MEHITNYKTAYNAALERARTSKSNKNLTIEEVVNNIFPELAVSEYERTRRDLIDFLYVSQDPSLVGHKEIKNRFIDWLDGLSEDSIREKAIADVTSHPEKYGLEKRSVKRKPKYNIGEWLHSKRTGKTIMILLSGADFYCFDTSEGDVGTMPIDELESQFSPWSVLDAEEFDILEIDGHPFMFSKLDHITCMPCGYFGLAEDGGTDRLIFPGDNGPWKCFGKVNPASSKLVNKLFSAMKAANLEFDCERRALHNTAFKD